MGLFDINIKRELQSSSKQTLCNALETQLSDLSLKPIEPTNTGIFVKNFKAKNALLKFDLSIHVDNSKKKPALNIMGELQDVWILVIVIVLAILLTYGIGVILVVGFVYYQKVIATRYLNGLIDECEKKES